MNTPDRDKARLMPSGSKYGRKRIQFDEEVWRNLPKAYTLKRRAEALGLSQSALDRRELLYAREGKGLWISGHGWMDATPEQVRSYLDSRGEA